MKTIVASNKRLFLATIFSPFYAARNRLARHNFRADIKNKKKLCKMKNGIKL